MKMNKLLIDKKVINVVNECKDLQIVIKPQENVILNFWADDLTNVNIQVIQEDNSEFTLNFASTISSDAVININSVVKGSNNSCKINVCSIAKSGKGIFNVCSKVEENTKNNAVVEDLKGLNEQGEISFVPILEIDTDDVNASHFATVGYLDQNILFYLQNKGISLQSACELLKRNFIYNLFDDDFISLLNKRKEDNE